MKIIYIPLQEAKAIYTPVTEAHLLMPPCSVFQELHLIPLTAICMLPTNGMREFARYNMNTDIITTIAGTGSDGYTGDGGQATAAKIYWPTGLAVHAGNLYIADQQANVIRAVNISSGIITTVAGNGTSGFVDNVAATAAELQYPSGVAFDKNGNMYIADTWNNRIRIVSTSGTITTFAGKGPAGYSGDGGTATNAKLQYPSSVAVDASGNVYIADNSNNRVRIVNTSGIISTYAGTGTAGFAGDGGAATAAELNNPVGVTLDASGNLYIADSLNERIREVRTSGIISTIAGNGTAGYNGDGIAATSAELYDPCQLALDAAGDIYIPDFFNNRVREVKICASTPITVKIQASPPFDTVICKGGSTTLIASGANTYQWSPITGLSSATGDTVVASPTVTTKYKVIGTGTGGVKDSAYITIVVNTSAAISVTPPLSVICPSTPIVLSTTGGTSPYKWTSSGSISCSTCNPNTVSPVASTTYMVTSAGCPGDTGKAVIWVSNPDDIFTVAGNGSFAHSGDSGLATAASLNFVTGVAFDSTYSNMYIADQQNMVIRKVDMNTNIISSIAGNGFGANSGGFTGSGGYSGDGGPATAAELNWPSSVTVYKGGLYIADQQNGAVRKVILSTGIITTVASGLTNPTGVAFDKNGNMYIADGGDNEVDIVNSSGTLSIFAGTGVGAYSGDGGVANAADLYDPTSVAVDASGNVYIGDRYNNRIRMVNTSGIISTVAGTGPSYPNPGGFSGDGGAATAAELYYPIGVTIDGSGNLHIADENNFVIREVNTSGIITTIIGDSASGGYNGDGIPATAAELNYPWAIALDAAGDFYIPDNINNRVREVKNCGTTPPVTVKSSVTGSVCEGKNDTLIASGGNGTFAWSPTTGLNISITGDTAIATPITTTTYVVTSGGSYFQQQWQ